MKIKKELLKRQVGGESFLVPLGKTVYDSNGLFVLNELGAFIWDLLPQADTEEAICNAVLEQYEVPAETAKQDVSAFLEKLREMDIL